MIEYIIAFLVGILVGTLGSGGAIVAIPAFIYLANYTPSKASSTSLLLVFFSSVIATLGYARKKQITYRNVLVFVPTGIIGSLAGTLLNGSMSENVLLGMFAAVLFLAAFSMLNKDRLIDKKNSKGNKELQHNVFAVGIAGILFGFITGLLGVGGGFLIVPLLAIVFSYETKDAIGTSVAIIAFNSVASLLFRTQNLETPFLEILPLALISITGVFLGLYLHSRTNEKLIQQIFGSVLFLLASYTLYDFVTKVA